MNVKHAFIICSLLFASITSGALVKNKVKNDQPEEAVGEITEETTNDIANNIEMNTSEVDEISRDNEDVNEISREDGNVDQGIGIQRYDEEPSDGSECYTLTDGSDYRGTVSTTPNGRTCQQWTNQSPHQHTMLPENYPNSGLGDHNYCRNPDNAAGPWCYTTDPAQRWEYCDVGSPRTKCSDETVGGGFVYTRWGHSSCPGNAKVVYNGIMSGKYYNTGGSGSNYLCLPEIPKYDDNVVVHGTQTDRASLYHVQFGGSTGPFASNRYHDVACAICLQEYRNNHFMYPGRDDCPNGWTREYYGYLMSADDHHGTTEYVCVDESGGSLPGTSSNVLGGLLNPVESKCVTGGGIPCAPYVDGYELTCAICSI